MFVQIAPFSQSFDDLGFTYSIPDPFLGEIKLGQIVEIELKTKITYGVVYKIFQNEIEIFNYTGKNIKNIKPFLSIQNKNIFLAEKHRTLLSFLARYYFAHIHHCIQLLIPKNTREKIMKDKIVFDKTGEYSYIYNNANFLTEHQQKAYDTIKSKQKPCLLFGLTGSGKTEIYIQIIKNNLDNNKQTLLLIPEIILGNQIAEKIKNVFGNDVLILNSTITEAKRNQYWLDIYHNKAQVIVGTRSALFYPYNNLAGIIIDEEHDKSYISDNVPRYDVREVSEILKVPVLLGSGTPSIKSMFYVQTGKYDLVQLLKRY